MTPQKLSELEGVLVEPSSTSGTGHFQTYPEVPVISGSYNGQEDEMSQTCCLDISETHGGAIACAYESPLRKLMASERERTVTSLG